jgi:hypothetical protein
LPTPAELLLTRSLGQIVALPMLVIDATGRLAYFNAAAAPLAGASYAEVGPLPPEEWWAMWAPTNIEGDPIPLERLPIMVALRQRRPAHGWVDFVGIDGVARRIEATAFPLETEDGLLLGALCLFWEPVES